MPNVIGEAIITVGADAENFNKELPKQTEPGSKAAGLNILGVLGKTVGAGAALVGGGIATLLGGALAKGFSRLTTIDDAQAKLKGLGMSTQQVALVMNSSLSAVKGTAFSMGEAVASSAILVASGVKPGTDLTRTLKLLADTATISGTSMDMLSDNFSDVAIAGHLTGESLQQLQDAGIPVVSFLSKSLGKSMQDVRKDIGAGKISFEEFQTAMEKGLGGAALASGKTFGGAMDNIGAALGRLGANLLGGAFSQLPTLMGNFTSTLDSLGPVAKNVGAIIGEVFVSKVVPVFKEITGSVQAFVGAFIAGDHDITSSGMPGFFEEVGFWARQVFNILLDDVVPAMVSVVTAGAGLIGFLKEHKTLTETLAVAIGALLVVTQAHAAVLAYQASTGLVAYITQLGIVQGAIKVWAAVQWALDAALNANPIALIVIGIAALVAAVVIAYKNSETFRDIVNAAWGAVKGAIGAVVDWITGSVVPWLVGAWDTISSGAKTLWGYITTAWNGIMAVLKAVGDWITSTFGPAFATLSGLIEFAFKAVEIIALAVWKLVIIPLFNLVGTAISALGTLFTWLWNNAVVPAFNGISAVVKAGWAIVSGIFDLIVAGVKIVGGWFSDLYTTYVKPKMDLIGSVVKTVWDTVVSPVFEAFKKGLSVLGDAFGTAVSAIKTAWDKIQDIVKAPIKFVIQTVLNGGLIKGFNWLSEKVGGPHIDDIPLPFATGGVTPGWSPGRDIHEFWSPTGGRLALSGGEAIMRPEFTKAMGGARGIAMLNKQAMAGRLSGPGNFAGGGVIDWIKSQSASALSWVGDTSSAIWNALSNPLGYLKGLMPSVPGGGVVPQYATAAGEKLLTSVVSKVTSLFADFNTAYDQLGGPIFAKVKAWVMDHLGIPYLWGGTGPQFDCSGFTQAALAAGGVSIPRTSEQQQAALRKVMYGAIKPGDLGFIGYPAHHVELYMGSGQWAEAPHTGDVTKIIGQGLGDFDGGFGAAFARGGVLGRPLLMDSGGVLPKGLSLVNNQTGSPEELRPPGANGVNVALYLSIDDLAKLRTLDDFLSMIGNARATARKIQRSGRVNV
jgi:tape measure domain-containing protein